MNSALLCFLFLNAYPQTTIRVVDSSNQPADEGYVFVLRNGQLVDEGAIQGGELKSTKIDPTGGPLRILVSGPLKADHKDIAWKSLITVTALAPIQRPRIGEKRSDVVAKRPQWVLRPCCEIQTFWDPSFGYYQQQVEVWRWVLLTDEHLDSGTAYPTSQSSLYDYGNTPLVMPGR